MTKALPFLTLIAMSAALLFGSPPAAARTTSITLLLICDMYELSPVDGRGGYAKVAGVVADERAKGVNVIVAHAGDALSPTLLSQFDQGEHVISLLNEIRPDVFVPGNHEFDFGPEIFRKRMAEAEFPVLAANLREKTGEAIGNIADHRLVELDGVNIGIIGLTAADSPIKSQPGDLSFADPADTLEREAQTLREEGADIIVAVAHTSRDIDHQIIASRAADVLLSGDDHDLWLQFAGKTAAVEAMQDGYYVVAVDLEIDVEEEDGKRDVEWWPNFRIIDTQSVGPHRAVAKMVEGYESELSAELDVALATTSSDLDSRNATVRGEEAAIGNLYTDAIRAATGADVAVLNGGSFRGNKVYRAGSEITRRDVLKELPFGNKTVILRVTGAQLRQAIEHGLSSLQEPIGRFPQISGMTVEADRSKPAGQRVVAVTIGGEPLDDSAAYKLATNDFLMRGGDGYDMLAEGEAIAGERDGKLIAADVMAYLRKMQTINSRVEGRLKIH